MMKVYENQEQEAILYQSFVNLSHSRDFVYILQWLQDSLNDARIANDTLVDADGRPLLSRNQGKSQVLDEILTINKRSKEVLEKILKNKDKME